MFLKLKNSIHKLMHMTALRQAVQLTFIFLVVVLISGITAMYLISREVDHRIDTELSMRYHEQARQIRRSKFHSRPFKRHDDHFEVYRPKKYQKKYSKNDDIADILPDDIDDDIDDVKGFSFLRPKARSGEKKDDEWRIYAAPTENGTLIVGTKLHERNEYLGIIFRVFVITGALILSITLLGGLFFGLRAQRRISAISNILKLVADGDLSARIGHKNTHDDFDQLSRTIDGTTAKLEILVRQIRDLTTNIAHDLRTPLTRLRGQLETLEEQVRDPQNLERALKNTLENTLENTLAQTDQIIDIFDALLRIAQLESGRHRSQFEQLDLGKLAEQISDIYGPVIEDSGRVFHLDIISPNIIKGDRALLVQMIANLIENSIKYSPQNAKITLSVKESCLALIDSGPGIPKDQYERAFEPMYRLEDSRSTAGSGLGLAMVKAIITLHHGKVIISENPERTADWPGLMIGIEFP